MKPVWRVTGDGGDFSNYLSRMTSMTITDEVGLDADKFEITLEDDTPEHELPGKDAKIDVYIGWQGQGLTHKGTFKYDSCAVKGPLRTMTLHFTAADMKGPIKARRSESYDKEKYPTFKDLAEHVGKRMGMPVKFAGDGIGEQKIDHEDQTGESDMAFLLRLAHTRGLFAKPSFGQLVIGKPGAGADGHTHNVHITEVSEWSAVLQARGGATKVKARVDDLTKGEVRYVTEGGGEGGGSGGGAQDVTRELLQGFATDEDAKAAAKASLEDQNRGTGTIAIEMPGDAKFFAEHHINVSEFSVKVDGSWRLVGVTDTLGADKWVTTLRGERKADVMSSGGGGSSANVVQFPVDGGGQTPGS